MEIIRHISEEKIIKVEGRTVHFSNRELEAQAIICATGYNADLNPLSHLNVKVDERTKFPDTKPSGESQSVENLFFAGPLAYRHLSSLLLHGFIKIHIF